jgi:enterochelin esterase-like enzyme
MKLRLVVVCLAVALLGACLPGVEREQQTEFDPLSTSPATMTPFQPGEDIHTPEATQTATPAPLPTATSTATPASLTCWEQGGQVIHAVFRTSVVAAEMPFTVYLPPCYEEEEGLEVYPLLVLLHGQTYDENQWLDVGLADAMDDLIRSGEIQPFVIAMPYESSDYAVVYERVLLDEWIPYLQAQYALCSGRECLAIGGISRGGGWAVTIAFRYPERFASLGIHSVPVWDGHLSIVRLSVGHGGVEVLPRIFVDVGSNDYWRNRAMDLVYEFDRLGVDYELTVNEGGHDNDYWRSMVAAYLRWYADGWQD